MEATLILDKIIEKGGIYGFAATQVRNDPANTDQFIIECFESCFSPEMCEHWGEELVLAIINYRVDLFKRSWRKGKKKT